MIDFDSFIKENFNADTLKLRLRYSNNPDIIKAIEQIELRRKAGDKFRVRELDFTPNVIYGAVSVEQSTSAAVAMFHVSLAPTAKKVLDMTMGIGIDAVAFSKINNAEIVGIELNSELAEISSLNYASIPNFKVINADSVQWIKNCNEKFDLIFIDPARRAVDGSRVYNVHDCTPDVTLLIDEIFSHAPRCMVKLSPMLDISATIKDLPCAKSIYIIEEKGECREILVDMLNGFDGETEIIAVNGASRFSFFKSEEFQAVPLYGVPSKGDILYEPWPSIMKVAPFRILSQKFGCKALGANTHLYFSGSIVDEFPGKRYRVDEVLPYQSSIIKRFSRLYGEASVSVRNFPDTAEKVKAKLKVKESALRRVIATTTDSGDKLLLLLSKI